MSAYRGANQGRGDIRSWYTRHRTKKPYVNKTKAGKFHVGGTNSIGIKLLGRFK